MENPIILDHYEWNGASWEAFSNGVHRYHYNYWNGSAWVHPSMVWVWNGIAWAGMIPV